MEQKGENADIVQDEHQENWLIMASFENNYFWLSRVHAGLFNADINLLI